MDVTGLPESLEPHSGNPAEIHATWRSSLLEHMLWVLSRGLIILFVVLVAYVGRIPFHHLIQRDVVLDMEQAEKEKILEQFTLISDLSVSAAKFDASFTDSASAVLQYAHLPGTSLRESAETKLRQSTAVLDRFRERFGTRQVRLPEDFEDDVIHLINDGSQGLRIQADMLREISQGGSTKLLVTFDAHKSLIALSAFNIRHSEQSFIARQRKP